MARHVTVPPISQLAVPVITEASGLVFVEPKHSVLARYCVRTANGVAEVQSKEKFTIVVSNFSKKPRKRPKHRTIGYATRNPLGIYSLDDEVSRDFKRCLNIPFVRKEDDSQQAEEEVVDTPPSAARPRKDWHDNIDVLQITNEDLCGEIFDMLSKHEAMWQAGYLGKVTATEHRIELVPGTNPIRQAPYRRGHKGRDLQSDEIQKMLDGGIIEPATSEWASPAVLIPKKDGSLYRLHTLDRCHCRWRVPPSTHG